MNASVASSAGGWPQRPRSRWRSWLSRGTARQGPALADAQAQAPAGAGGERAVRRYHGLCPSPRLGGFLEVPVGSVRFGQLDGSETRRGPQGKVDAQQGPRAAILAVLGERLGQPGQSPLRGSVVIRREPAVLRQE